MAAQDNFNWCLSLFTNEYVEMTSPARHTGMTGATPSFKHWGSRADAGPHRHSKPFLAMSSADLLAVSGEPREPRTLSQARAALSRTAKQVGRWQTY